MIIMDNDRFEQRLKEANEAYTNSLEWMKVMKGNDEEWRIEPSALAAHMAYAHMRSTLRYINGDFDDLMHEISKDSFTAMYHFGLMKEDSMKYALSQGYLELEDETIKELIKSKV